MFAEFVESSCENARFPRQFYSHVLNVNLRDSSLVDVLDVKLVGSSIWHYHVLKVTRE